MHSDGDLNSMEAFIAITALLMLVLVVAALYFLKDHRAFRREFAYHAENTMVASSSSTASLEAGECVPNNNATAIQTPRETTSGRSSRSFLARFLGLDTTGPITRLDLERCHDDEVRWRCSICDFANGQRKSKCLLCGTRRSTSIRKQQEQLQQKQQQQKTVRESGGKELKDACCDDLRASKAELMRESIRLSRNFSDTNLRFTSLNTRQRYARKRKEWKRQFAADGSAVWVRREVLRTKRSNRQDPGGQIRMSSHSDSRDSIGRCSSGFVLCRTPSSLLSEGRLTLSDIENVDAACNFRGNRMRSEELETLERVSQLPFPKKFAWFLEKTSSLMHKRREGRIKLCVQRDNILVDSMEQLLGIQKQHLLYPIQIEFIGEKGIDAGGLQREWYSLLFDQLFDPKLGLFVTCHRSNQTVMINPNSKSRTNSHLLYFRGAGRLVGRALLEGQTMQARLCLPILKALLGIPMTFSDLQYVDPEVYNSMCWLRDHNDIESLALTFSVTEFRDGKPTVIDLKENGNDIVVTDATKCEFLHLKLRYLILDRYAKQLEEMLNGVFEVIPQEILMVFDYQELELVLGGMPEIDVDEWKRFTVVPKECAEFPVLKWFWQVIQFMSQDDRARFLQFCTGSPRVPVQGFKALTSHDGRICHFCIRPLVHQTTGFPVVHTCFNRIELPVYKTKEELEEAIYTVLDMEWQEFDQQ